MPKKKSIAGELCPMCGEKAVLVRDPHRMPMGRRRVVVEDERWRCRVCKEEFYTPDQANAAMREVAAKIRAEDALLSPEQIRAIRHSLGVTQEEFEKLLGVGPKSTARWEGGTVTPNKATDRLIRLVAANPENVRLLAAINGFVFEHPTKLGAA